MTIVAHAHPFVIGVDAHARNHAVAVLACPTGEVVEMRSFLPPSQDSSEPSRGSPVAPVVISMCCG
jgi:hypothetical protein